MPAPHRALARQLKPCEQHPGRIVIRFDLHRILRRPFRLVEPIQAQQRQSSPHRRSRRTRLKLVRFQEMSCCVFDPAQLHLDDCQIELHLPEFRMPLDHRTQLLECFFGPSRLPQPVRFIDRLRRILRHRMA